MTEVWDDQERKADTDQILRPPVVRVRKGRGTRDDPWTPSPGFAPNLSMWMRWGFPAGLSIGILIGFFVAFALFFLWMMARGAFG